MKQQTVNAGDDEVTRAGPAIPKINFAWPYPAFFVGNSSSLRKAASILNSGFTPAASSMGNLLQC